MNYKFNRYKDISFSHLKLKKIIIKKKILEKKSRLNWAQAFSNKKGKKKDLTQLETQPSHGQYHNKIKVLKNKISFSHSQFG